MRVLVTGAASGIGRATCVRLARDARTQGQPAKVAAVDAAERYALVPVGRVATPDDMAAVTAFLLGPDARYVTGHDLVADGGVSGNFLGRLPGLSRIERG
jgi:NAD(P)-dependent dehydrogenase (short-subunit alcohol dehydrogenase family)